MGRKLICLGGTCSASGGADLLLGGSRSASGGVLLCLWGNLLSLGGTLTHPMGCTRWLLHPWLLEG